MNGKLVYISPVGGDPGYAADEIFVSLRVNLRDRYESQRASVGRRSPTGDQKFVFYSPCFLLNPPRSLRRAPRGAPPIFLTLCLKAAITKDSKGETYRGVVSSQWVSQGCHERSPGLERYGRYNENFALVRRSVSPKRKRGPMTMTLACASGSCQGWGGDIKGVSPWLVSGQNARTKRSSWLPGN